MSDAAERGPDATGPLRLLSVSASLLWGLQDAMLYPTLALVLVSVYGATAAEVGWILGLGGAGGLLAAVILPRYAARRPDSLHPVLLAGCLALALAVVLGLGRSLPAAMIALVVLGGPAGVGSRLLSAHLRRRGVGRFALAWVIGPPLAMLITSAFGPRSVLVAVAFVAVLNVATTMFMINLGPAPSGAPPPPPGERGVPGAAAGPVLRVGHVALEASAAAVISIMCLFVVETRGLDVVWAGIALGAAAAVRIPALLVIGTFGQRSSFPLMISGCLAGVVYCGGMTLVHGPVMLLLLQILGGWAAAAAVGVGPTAGFGVDTRWVGAVVAGPVIALSAVSALGYRGVFLACVALAMTGLGCVLADGVIARVTPGLTARAPGPGNRSS